MTILQSIQLAYKSKGYKFFSKGAYNLNVFGIRNNSNQAGKFDDKVGVIYVDDSNKPHVHLWDATTDPGIHWLSNPLNKDGTAIMLKGQYRGAYKLGIHGRTWASGGYDALEQVKPMKYIRDNNKDDKLDFSLAENEENIIEDILKTNIHRASKWKLLQYIGKYSAGCQVIRSIEDFNLLISLCRKQILRGHGNSFTYTLFDSYDVFKNNWKNFI